MKGNCYVAEDQFVLHHSRNFDTNHLVGRHRTTYCALNFHMSLRKTCLYRVRCDKANGIVQCGLQTFLHRVAQLSALQWTSSRGLLFRHSQHGCQRNGSTPVPRPRRIFSFREVFFSVCCIRLRFELERELLFETN